LCPSHPGFKALSCWLPNSRPNGNKI
jgi:hypothetical protein